MKKRLLIYSLALITLFSCDDQQKKVRNTGPSNWQLVFKNDKEGQVVYGSKEKLLEAVRNGDPVRIGFGGRRANDTTKSVEHFADAKFLTIANGREVFAQIDPIVGQNPDLDSAILSINFRENSKWTIMVGTNGFSDRLNIDVFKDSILGHHNRPTEVSWFVEGNLSDLLDNN